MAAKNPEMIKQVWGCDVHKLPESNKKSLRVATDSGAEGLGSGFWPQKHCSAVRYLLDSILTA